MNQGGRIVRDLAVLILVGAVCGCGDEDGSSGTGGSGGAGGTGGVAALQEEYVLSDQELVPESGAYDSVGRAFYVGSGTKGSITRVDVDGTESLFFDPPPSSSLRTLGVAIDADARRLWVCLQDTGAPSQSVWTFDLSTGEADIEFDLASAAADATCNDIALDSEGVAYVSDSANPRVYRANVDGKAIEIWADDPLLAGDSERFGGNGIAVTEDDQYVLLSKTLPPSTTPQLLRIERANPKNIDGITTMPEITGSLDGMSFLGGHLYLADVLSGGMLRLTSEDAWETASIASSMQAAGTSTVRPAEGELYAIYSDILASISGSPLSPPFRIYRIDLASFE
jgi:sugar lactone lactonase YvrE